MNGKEAGLAQNIYRTTGWNTTRRLYMCRDRMKIEVQFRTANIKGLEEWKMLPSSGVIYARDA